MSNEKKMDNYFIKEGYRIRSEPTYFVDNSQGITYQPDVYSLAYKLAKKFESKYIIDIGCGNGDKLNNFHRKFNVVGIDYGVNLKKCQQKYPQGMWLEHDLDSSQELPIPKKFLENAVIICADVIEHLKNPKYLLKNLKQLMNYAAVCLVSTPERNLVRGSEDFGPPANPSHVREWNIKEFNNLLNHFNFNVEFVGLTMNNDKKLEKKTILGVIGNQNIDLKSKDDFKVAAIMTVYNEEDIIYHTIKKFLDQDIHVYIVDNWSTDNSFQIINNLKKHPNFLGVERFPFSGPSETYDWTNLLHRVEELATTIEADWFIHNDADEIRMAPWDMSLKDAICYVDSLGYNAINHNTINFQPVDNGYLNQDPEEYFSYFKFGKRYGHFHQIKIWKNTGQKVNLSKTGGHCAKFKGRKVCPYKFLNKHYAIRSQEHGELKVFKERKPRWNSKERRKGWHTQYNNIRPGHSFLKDKDKLNKYIDDYHFRTKYLVEMISGIGIKR